MSTGTTFVPSVCPHLQRGLLGLDNMLLGELGLLQGRVWLQDDSIHGTAQRVVSCLRESVHNRGWSHCMLLLLLLPCLRHPSTVDAGRSALGGGRIISQILHKNGCRGINGKPAFNGCFRIPLVFKEKPGETKSIENNKLQIQDNTEIM